MDFFRPRWRHSDPSVREHAVWKLSDPALLTEIAQKDSNSSVRSAAIGQLVKKGGGDPALLAEIIQKARNLDAYEAAVQKNAELWALLNREWDRLMTYKQDQIPRPQGHDGHFFEIRRWEVASEDGTQYEISLISERWDPLPDGKPAIKVRLDIGGGKLKGQGM